MRLQRYYFFPNYEKKRLNKSKKVLYVVVNCFQICIFVSVNTTVNKYAATHSGCELLSNLYLCLSSYNLGDNTTHPPHVVNCFQICIFVSDNTTHRQYPSTAAQL